MKRLMATQRRSRRGFSRVELIVVAACVLVIVLIVVPFLLHRRELQRRIGCQNRLKDVAFGFVEYAHDHDGAYPWLEDGTLPWTVRVLPYFQNPPDALLEAVVGQPESEWPTEMPAIYYLCPNGQAYPPGANCYVANGGIGEFTVDPETDDVQEPQPHTQEQDWDGDGMVGVEEIRRSQATGLIWRKTDGSEPVTESQVAAADGLGATLLLSENLNAERWLSRKTFDLVFVVGRDRIQFGPAERRWSDAVVKLGVFRPGAYPGQKPGRCPVPSSLHAEGVNVVYADGRGETLSPQIDPLVYLRLMSWRDTLSPRAAPDE